MATQSSKIEWTESTWNPVRGCTRVSEGCRFCYAERIAARFSGKGMAYEGLAENTKAGPRWTQVPFFFKQWGGKRKSKTGRKLNGRTYDEMPV